MITLRHKPPEVKGTSGRSLQSGVSSVKTIGGVIANPVDDKSFMQNGERSRWGAFLSSRMWQGPGYHLLRTTDTMLEAPDLRVDLGF
jgi:hypothetical protein